MVGVLFTTVFMDQECFGAGSGNIWSQGRLATPIAKTFFHPKKDERKCGGASQNSPLNKHILTDSHTDISGLRASNQHLANSSDM